LQYPNILTELCPDDAGLSGVIHVCRPEGMEIFSDVTTQRVVCR